MCATRSGVPMPVPHVGVLGDRAQRLPLARAADHDRQVRLDRAVAPGADRRTGSGRPAGEVATPPSRTVRTPQTASSSQSRRWPGLAPKSMPWARVLVVEPRAAEAEDRPAVADVVERRGHLGHEPGIAEGVGTDQQPQPDARCDLRPRGQRHPALEDRLLRLAEDRVQVVPRPEVVVAELVDALGGALERRPVGRHVPEQDAHRHAGFRGHRISPLLACAE